MPVVVSASSQAAEDVERDLDDVEQMQQHRGTEADLGPVPGHRDDLLGAGALAPLLEVDLRSFLFEKSHGGKIRTCSSQMVPVRRIAEPLTTTLRSSRTVARQAFYS